MTTELKRPSWRDVPIPKRVARRPVATSGPRMPVPYVAQSIAEQKAIDMRPGTKQDGPLEGVTLVSHRGFDRRRMEAQASDPYDFGQMNEERQRDCMLTPRCQVCAMQLSPKGPWLHHAGDPDNVSSTRAGDRQVIVFREPAVCRVCLDYAMRICPGLRRAARENVGTVYRVWQRELCVEALDVRPSPRSPPKKLASFDEARRHSIPNVTAGVRPTLARTVSLAKPILAVYNVVSLAVEWEAWTWDQWLNGRAEHETPKWERVNV